jgi:hypothetical protein
MTTFAYSLSEYDFELATEAWDLYMLPAMPLNWTAMVSETQPFGLICLALNPPCRHI